MTTERYRQTAIEFLLLAKLFTIVAFIGRQSPALSAVFFQWNTLLAIVFSFTSTASWMLAGWKSEQERTNQ